MGTFLDAVRERVVVFDGATGTNLHERDLSIDDYGGPQFEGCPEILNVTRPDVIRDLHDSFFAVGCDVVETNSFGGFSTVLIEYGIPERAHELSRQGGAHRQARSPTATAPTGSSPARLGPGTKMATLNWITFAELRDSYEDAAHGLLDGGVDLIIIETVQDLLQAKAAMIARPARHEGDRPRGADPGPGHDRDDRPHAARHRDRRGAGRRSARCGPTSSASTARPVRRRCTSTCGTCRRTRRSRSPACPTPACRRSSTAQTHYDLTPDQLADAHARIVTELGITVVGGCCGTTPEHLQPRRRAVRRPHAADAHAGASSRASSSMLHAGAASRRRRSYLVDRRAHQRQRLEGVPRRAARRRTGTPAKTWRASRCKEGSHAHRPVRRLRRPRRRARHERVGPSLRRTHRRAPSCSTRPSPR